MLMNFAISRSDPIYFSVRNMIKLAAIVINLRDMLRHKSVKSAFVSQVTSPDLLRLQSKSLRLA